MLVLADLQADGQIQSLGTTNLDTEAVEMLTDADIRLVSNQVHSLSPLTIMQSAFSASIESSQINVRKFWSTLEGCAEQQDFDLLLSESCSARRREMY